MLAHTRTGSGEPVLFVHGITHRRQGWRTVAPLLEDSFEVIAVDLPDHGESSALPPDYAGDSVALADALDEFVDELGIDRPHVVGNSLGGLLALEMAARGSARTALALSPAGFWSTAERIYARGVLAGASATLQRMTTDRLRRTLSSPTGAKALLGAIMAHPERHNVDDLVADLQGLARPRTSFPTMLGALQTWAVSGPVAVPTVAAWGTRDRLLPPHQYRRLAEQQPRVEIYSLVGCGHVPMGDDPEAVADLVRYTAALR